MKPEARQCLDKARRCLDHARANLQIDIGDDAGRNAYLAGFHAAQALIFERTSKVAKTHRGVHTQFEKLAKDEPRLARDRRFRWIGLPQPSKPRRISLTASQTCSFHRASNLNPNQPQQLA